MQVQSYQSINRQAADRRQMQQASESSTTSTTSLGADGSVSSALLNRQGAANGGRDGQNGSHALVFENIAATIYMEGAVKGDSITGDFIQSFGDAAQDQSKFHELAKSVFGDNYDQQKAEQFRQRALAGDFSWLPKVEYVASETLGGGNGAYSEATNTIYINNDIKGTELARQTFVEEAGHYLDAQLNSADTRGDEGELFRRLLSGETMSAQQVSEIRSEDDSGIISIDGKEIEVEFWSLGGAISSIGNAVSSAASSVGNAVSSAVSSASNVVSNVVSSASNVVSNVVSSASNVVSNVVSSASNVVSNVVSSASNVVSNVVSSASNFVSSVGSVVSSSAQWLNNNIVQPVITTAVELVKDVAPIAQYIFQWPVNTAMNFATGVGSTVGHLFRGEFSQAWGAAVDTVKDIVKAPVEGVITVGAMALNSVASGINNLFGLSTERGLTAQEIAYLRPIFGNSIDYADITIHRGGIKELLGISPQTVGNDVFLRENWGGAIFDSNGDLTPAGLELMSHEAGHVWQNQNGGAGYIGEALVTQGLDWVDGHAGTNFSDGYDVVAALNDGLAFQDMNPEQQGNVTEYIGEAILANGSGTLTQTDFENAVGPGYTMTAAQFTIIQNAHATIKAGG